jgi:hypothetical protein
MVTARYCFHKKTSFMHILLCAAIAVGFGVCV